MSEGSARDVLATIEDYLQNRDYYLAMGEDLQVTSSNGYYDYTFDVTEAEVDPCDDRDGAFGQIRDDRVVVEIFDGTLRLKDRDKLAGWVDVVDAEVVPHV